MLVFTKRLLVDRSHLTDFPYLISTVIRLSLLQATCKTSRDFICTIDICVTFCLRLWIVTTSAFCYCYHVWMYTCYSNWGWQLLLNCFPITCTGMEIKYCITRHWINIQDSLRGFLKLLMVSLLFETYLWSDFSLCYFYTSWINKKSHSIHIFWSLSMTASLLHWRLFAQHYGIAYFAYFSNLGHQF